MAGLNKEQLLEDLRQRREKTRAQGQIDNSMLDAGSPMYFYCWYCGAQSDVKPESYTDTPNHVCEDCQTLLDQGWHDGEKPHFPLKWQLERASAGK